MKKRLLGILLSFALMLTMMPVLGLSLTAYADAAQWSENKTFNSNETFNDGVEVTSNITITIAEGKTVTVQKGIIATSCTLTVEGNGNLIVNGRNWDSGTGDPAFKGSIIVKGGKVTLTGGAGNPDGEHDAGGNGIEGNVEVSGGSFSATGGDGYTVGKAVSNTITCGNDIVAQASDDGSEWSDISGTSSNKQYVRTIQKYNLRVGGVEVTSEKTSGDGWSYEPSTNTLTLKGAKISSNDEEGIQYNNRNTPLKIALSPGTVNEVVTTRSDWPAIGPAYGGISISGSGELKVIGKGYGIHAGSLTIESGTINIEASEEDGLGIFMSESPMSESPVTINGGNVTVTGKKYAIAKSSEGGSTPVTGSVKNAITGTGWTDTAGTQGETVIPVNKEGQTLGEYKKVQFGASPAPAPAANPLTVTTTARPSAKSMTVKWTWNSVEGAKKYKVSYHKVGSKKWTTKTTKKTKYVVKGHKFNGLYEYKVAAVTASGDVWSDVNCRYFKRVKATAKAGKAAGTVKASWKKDKGAAGYKVLLATNKKMNNAQAVEVSADQKSYTFSGLKSGKKYYVKVRPLKNYNGVTYHGIYTKALRVKTK